MGFVASVALYYCPLTIWLLATAKLTAPLLLHYHMSMWVLPHARHSQPLLFPWPYCWLFSWFSSIHKSPFTATFGMSLPTPTPKCLGLMTMGLSSSPALFICLPPLFLSAFFLAHSFFLCGRGRFHPWRESPLCLLFFFVSRTLVAAHPQTPRALPRLLGALILLIGVFSLILRAPSTSLLPIHTPHPAPAVAGHS